MFSRLRIYLSNFDWIIFAAVFLLVAFGLLEIYSVALGQGSFNLFNFQKQLLLAGIGFAGLFIFAFFDSYFLKSLNLYFYVLAVLLLLGVLVFGATIRGTRGWFAFAGFNLQPVEFVKIVLILFLANFFSGLATKVKTIRHFLFSALGAGFLITLALLQPDFGSAMILSAIWLLMIIVAGFNKKYDLLCEKYNIKPNDSLFQEFREIWNSAKIGKVNSEEFFSAIANKLNTDPKEVKELLISGISLNENVKDLILKLRNRYKIGILTNNIKEFYEADLKLWNFEEIGEVVASFKTGVAKPDPEAIQLILDKLNVTKEETIFIDDHNETTSKYNKIILYFLKFFWIFISNIVYNKFSF